MKKFPTRVILIVLTLAVASAYVDGSQAQEAVSASAGVTGTELLASAATSVAEAKPRRYIVTDVDDTVKLTDVAHLTDALIRATFSKKTFAGISTLYRELSASNAESVLYFVSGSPRIIRSRVVEMIVENHFPRPWVLSLRNLSVPTQKYKVAKISEIIEQLPSDAQVILVGDDGEKDPETYAELLAKYPKRVDSIYIHRIQGRNLPAGQIAYDTPMDIAVVEMEKGSLSPEQAVRVGKAVLAESRRDDEKLVLPYNFCPTSFEAPGQHAPLPEGHDAYELSSKIQGRIQQICLDRMEDLEILKYTEAR